MIQIKNKVVVITGASQGIGKHLALEFARRGAITIICARSVKRLKEVELTAKHENGNVFSVVLDVTSEISVRSTVNKVIKKYGRIDVLVNNAGVGLFETIAKSKREDIKKVFDTNFFGPLSLMQFVLPHMRKRKQGMIVNISSAISKYSLFHQGIYAASKAALERITESADIEENRFGIKTLLVIPDRTRTHFRKHIVGPKKLARLPFKLPESDPQKVAKKIVDSIVKERCVVHTSLRSRAYHIAASLWPRYVGAMLKNSYKAHRKD